MTKANNMTKAKTILGSFPFASIVKIEGLLCPDGIRRNTSRVSEPDSFDSIPCAVRYEGKTVSGFATSIQFSDGDLRFVPTGKHRAIFDPACSTMYLPEVKSIYGYKVVHASLGGMVAYRTSEGLRYGRILGFRWSQWEQTEGVSSVCHTKGAGRRIVILAPSREDLSYGAIYVLRPEEVAYYRGPEEENFGAFARYLFAQEAPTLEEASRLVERGGACDRYLDRSLAELREARRAV